MFHSALMTTFTATYSGILQQFLQLKISVTTAVTSTDSDIPRRATRSSADIPDDTVDCHGKAFQQCLSLLRPYSILSHFTAVLQSIFLPYSLYRIFYTYYPSTTYFVVLIRLWVPSTPHCQFSDQRPTANGNRRLTTSFFQLMARRLFSLRLPP